MMYLWLLSCALKSGALNNGFDMSSYTLKANMVVVETIPSFRSRVFYVTNKHIQKGLSEFKKLLILAADE